MLRRYKLEIDDNIILNNLDTFKAQLHAQMQYCEDVQNEIKKSNETLQQREKKYQKLKAAHKILSDKCARLDYENAGLRSQIDVLRIMLLNNGMGHMHHINTPIVNTIQHLPPPPPPPPSAPPKSAHNNYCPMDHVLNELKNKIKKTE